MTREQGILTLKVIYINVNILADVGTDTKETYVTYTHPAFHSCIHLIFTLQNFHDLLHIHPNFVPKCLDMPLIKVGFFNILWAKW